MLDSNITQINLKGFLVGNGATDWDFDVMPSFPETAYNFNVIPKSLLDEYQKLECTVYFNGVRNSTGTDLHRCE